MAGDAAGREVYGFSPDGRYFAFAQFNLNYDAEGARAVLFVIDTTRDAFAAGTPLAVEDKEALELEPVVEPFKAKIAPVLKRLAIGQPGVRIAGAPSFALDETSSLYAEPKPFSTELDLSSASGGRLLLRETPALRKSVCKTARQVDQDISASGFRLELVREKGRAILMNEDKRLPASRRCAKGYGLAEAYLHRSAAGVETIAVLVEFADYHEYHAGPNRRLMAVARQLGKR